jgi:hypothetical protein
MGSIALDTFAKSAELCKLITMPRIERSIIEIPVKPKP